jgi:hypothetical protein
LIGSTICSGMLITRAWFTGASIITAYSNATNSPSE